MDTQQNLYICCLQETHFRSRGTHRLKMSRWKNIPKENRNQKKAGVAILISDNIDFKIKTVTRERSILHNDQGINPQIYMPPT